MTAASDWNEPAQRRTVRPAVVGSYEALFHETGIENLYLDLGVPDETRAMLDVPRLQRAIGGLPSERMSHYFRTRLTKQFDALFHYDRTRAVEPLERTALWTRGEFPDTYPTALSAGGEETRVRDTLGTSFPPDAVLRRSAFRERAAQVASPDQCGAAGDGATPSRSLPG